MFYAIRWIKLDLTCQFFLKKNKLTHCCFKYSPSICNSWIDRIDFFIFRPVRFASAQLPSSPFFLLSDTTSPPINIATLYYASIPLRQDELVASTSSSDNASSCHLPSRAKTKVFNSHHRRRPPSSDHPILTLHYYKKFISTCRSPYHSA
jgi:hypothetical protein